MVHGGISAKGHYLKTRFLKWIKRGTSVTVVRLSIVTCRIELPSSQVLVEAIYQIWVLYLSLVSCTRLFQLSEFPVVGVYSEWNPTVASDKPSVQETLFLKALWAYFRSLRCQQNSSLDIAMMMLGKDDGCMLQRQINTALTASSFIYMSSRARLFKKQAVSSEVCRRWRVARASSHMLAGWPLQWQYGSSIFMPSPEYLRE